MQKFTEQTFTVPELTGISKKTIDEHIKLYSGYVKNSNLIFEKIEEYMADSEKNAYALGELQRRFSFEFNGMRNHEHYFKSLEGGAAPLSEKSALRAAIEKEFGSFDAWQNRFKAIGLTRGIGWAVLYYDPATKRVLNAWIDEQHIGQLNGLSFILGLDMWEHSFLFDYVPADKKKYIEAFFANLNWNVIEESFANAVK